MGQSMNVHLKSTTAHWTRHTEIDTARRYGNGSSETMLGELKCQERGLLISTKYLPAVRSNPEAAIPEGWGTSMFAHTSIILRILMRQTQTSTDAPIPICSA